MDILKKLIIKNGNQTFLQNIEIDNAIFENFFENLGYDSISIISLIVDIENEYGIEIDDNYLNINNLNSIENIKEIISNKGKYNDDTYWKSNFDDKICLW